MAMLYGCEEDITPRPTGYPRVYFPAKEYLEYQNPLCPYVLQIPVYSEMLQDEKYTEGRPCWYNLSFKPFDATLHISYHTYESANEYDSLYEDTRKMVYKHIVRADDIEEIDIESQSELLDGVIYQLKGNTATQFNFFITDRDSRYFRGALYFNSKTNPDSIAPVYQFIREDLLHMIHHFKWK